MSMENKACCRLPAVVNNNYTPKGDSSGEVNGLKGSYIVGEKSSKKHLLICYDIFGLDFSQVNNQVTQMLISERLNKSARS